MINLTFMLEKTIVEKFHSNSDYGIFTFAIYGDRDHLRNFERPLKRYFNVKGFTNNHVSQHRYNQIIRLTEKLISQDFCNKMNLRRDDDMYHLMLFVDDKNYNKFKASLGDSSFALINIDDFKFF